MPLVSLPSIGYVNRRLPRLRKARRIAGHRPAIIIP